MYSNRSTGLAHEEADPRNHRVARRHKTFELTSMTGPDGITRIHLINVSETGALVHAAEPPQPGSQVIINLGDATAVQARVVWSNGPRFGVAFRNRLSETTIRRVVTPS